MKYIVLSRDKETDMILNSYGCFRRKGNANKRLDEVLRGSYGSTYYDQEYLVEEVDPCGSFANDECEDEEE